MPETILLGVLRRCLADDGIGPDDNFYAMGGDSIVALDVIAQAMAEGVEVDLLDLLTSETVRDLAARATIARAVPEAASTGLTDDDLALLPEAAVRARPASALQVGLVYLAELAEESGAYLDFMGVRVRGPFVEQSLRAALERLLDRHEALRSSFDLATYSVAAQIVWASATAPLEVEEHGTVSEWQDRILGEGIDLEQPPALRCHALVSADHFRLTLATHHSLVDGWSFARLLVDLLLLYDAELRHDSADLRAVPANGHDEFVRLERDATESAAAKAFWAGENLVPLRSVEANPSCVLRFDVDREALRAAANDLGVPVKSLCLAAHGWALGQWLGQDRVVTGLVMNCRPEVDGADQLVGLFLNTVPVCLDTVGGWPELAEHALLAERLVTPHRRFPLASVTELVGGPVFDVSFNFTHFHVYRELDRLRQVRADTWWSRDRATFPMLVNVFVDDPASGTGGTVEFDPELVTPVRAEEFRDLLRHGLHAATHP
nr:Non-ribosomal peptide synthetase [Kibdelosporangium sp. MJ126-NF4]